MKSPGSVRRAGKEDAPAVAELAAALWPEHTAEEMAEELTSLLAEASCAVFLAEADGRTIAFAQSQLRHDYVEGTASSPVGYLEGIYVAEAYRRQGIAGALLRACEGWAREAGCREFASDCELTNEESLRFHLGLGFTEANRIICFVKPL
ncbi:MAG: GNAT family N-acetyltransferase [Clostridia bacterium]|nr:GNAT family N-acetyltransferase [Clostridia bacterium]